MVSGLKRISFGIVILVVLLAPPFFSCTQGVAENKDIRVYFSPNGGCEKAIIEEIGKAKSHIHVAMFNFTNGRIARALVKASRLGIDVKVVMDRERALDIYSKNEFLKKKNIGVKLMRGPCRDSEGRKTGLMHDKFAVIDGKVVIAGSYNWTTSAEKWIHENLLIVSSVRVADLFEREFRKLWMEK
jgi:phosphatidylserine/phosphatidylglycerophosphate/cardiolipin synthase-like enzyme